jgi:parallel beta-helix repeat protein
LDSVTGTVIEGSDISGCAEAIFGGWSYAVTGTIIEGNSVHSNTGAGIVITAGTGNRIQGNSIYDNGGLGIDLGGNGITPNDAGDTDTGPNNYQNFPVLASVLGGSTTRIQGSLNSTPDTTFILDFYASSGADPSGYGEGERYLGAASVTTDAVGNGSFDVKLKAQTGLGEFVTATATDPQGNTSEFSMGMTINELSTANVSGEVFVDVNQNGEYDADEPGIDGVTIELLDENGTPVLDVEGQRVIAMTSDGGFYLFEGVDPGIYQLHEVQPTGVEDGAEILGSLGGTIPANDTMRLLLEGDEASDYAFAELGLAVTSGDTATIGFWQSKNGQKLIGLGGAGLADWLTANFGNVFGNVLVGGDGETVAGFFKKQLFLQKAEKSAEPAKVDAQYMAVALATYFTSSYLAGNVAGEFGFHVTDTGIGTRIVNVGICGAAFGEANGTDLTIMQLLLATNDRTDVPDSVIGFAWIYDENGDGLIDAAEAELRRLANEVYSAINEAGDR